MALASATCQMIGLNLWGQIMGLVGLYTWLEYVTAKEKNCSEPIYNIYNGSVSGPRAIVITGVSVCNIPKVC